MSRGLEYLALAALVVAAAYAGAGQMILTVANSMSASAEFVREATN